jgi:crotonobetainyl-CoA:carnitine CoA-transferase CaiB-like acyl-CoA transferase
MRLAPQVIAAWVAGRPSGEVVAALGAARVPAGPILSIADIAGEAQYQARGMLQRAAPPSGECARLHAGCPPRGGGCPPAPAKDSLARPMLHPTKSPSVSTLLHFLRLIMMARRSLLCPCSLCRAGGPEVLMPAMAPLLSATPGSIKWAGPELGEHTEEVLTQELGMTAAEVAALRAEGAI